MISESDVLYEDNHLIAIQKRPGQLVQGDKTGDIPLSDLVKDFLKVKYDKPGKVYLATLHRLDRPVSGLVLFAKTSKAAERMSKAFQKHWIQKTYWAILPGSPHPSSGEIKSYLVKDAKTNRVSSHHFERKDGKEAITTYHTEQVAAKMALVSLGPKTGRSHQLRVHCALEMKLPILGDVKYGSKEKTSNRSLYLLSKKMVFAHPVTKASITIEARIPEFGHWKKFS